MGPKEKTQENTGAAFERKIDSLFREAPIEGEDHDGGEEEERE